MKIPIWDNPEMSGRRSLNIPGFFGWLASDVSLDN
jgi:hypothetical protein